MGASSSTPAPAEDIAEHIVVPNHTIEPTHSLPPSPPQSSLRGKENEDHTPHTAAGAYIHRSCKVTPVLEVSLSKGAATNLIGLTLDGENGPPRVKETEPASLAALSGRIKPDQIVLSVNGLPVNGHEQATAIIKESVGEVKFVLSDDNPFVA